MGILIRTAFNTYVPHEPASAGPLRAIKYRLKGSAVFGMIRLARSELSCDAVREHGAESNLSHMNNSVSEDFYTNDSIPEECAEYAQESGF